MYNAPYDVTTIPPIGQQATDTIIRCEGPCKLVDGQQATATHVNQSTFASLSTQGSGQQASHPPSTGMAPQHNDLRPSSTTPIRAPLGMLPTGTGQQLTQPPSIDYTSTGQQVTTPPHPADITNSTADARPLPDFLANI